MRGDQKCSCHCHWDWGWLNAAFAPTPISLSNVDFAIIVDNQHGVFSVERRGFLVMIETKYADQRDEVNYGQLKLLTEFSTKPGCVSILLYGARSQPELMEVCRAGRWREPQHTNREDFVRRMRAWFEWVNSPTKTTMPLPFSM